MASNQYLLESDADWLANLAREFPHPHQIAADMLDLAARIRKQIRAPETSATLPKVYTSGLKLSPADVADIAGISRTQRSTAPRLPVR